MAIGIGVLPQNPEVFFVEADAVLRHVDFAGRVGDHRIQIDDLAETITAERQRVRVVTETKLARIEGSLAGRAIDADVAVGDDEFGDRHAVSNLAFGAVIVKADVVDDEALALAVAEAKAPALPIDLPAIDGKRGAFGLDDLERLEGDVAAGLADAIRTGCLGRRNTVGVFDLDDLGGIDRDDRMESADRVCVLVGVGRGAVPHRSPKQAPTIVEVLRDVDTEGPGLHVDLRYVVDAPLS